MPNCAKHSGSCMLACVGRVHRKVRCWPLVSMSLSSTHPLPYREEPRWQRPAWCSRKCRMQARGPSCLGLWVKQSGSLIFLMKPKKLRLSAGSAGYQSQRTSDVIRNSHSIVAVIQARLTERLPWARHHCAQWRTHKDLVKKMKCA